MPDEIKGDNAPAIDRNAELAALRADVGNIEAKAKEAQESAVNSQGKPADTTIKTQENPSTLENPEALNKDNPAQSKEDGDVSEEKIQKDTEHLKADFAKKEARKAELLKQYKDLQRQYTPLAQEVKKLEREIQSPAPSESQEPEMDIPQDFRTKFAQDLEKDPISGIVRYTKAAIDAELARFRQESGIDQFRESMVDQKRDKELDSLAKEGHSWIHEEGLERFVPIFKERPFLLNSPTPFRDAVRFMEGLPSKGNAQPPAQGPRTPVLSASGALPPPTSPTETAESSFADLDAKYDRAIKRGDIREAKKIMSKMGALLDQR